MLANTKVLFFVRSFPVLSQTFVLNQVKDLVNEGIDVQVLSVNPSNDATGLVEDVFGESVSKKVTSILPSAHSSKSYLHMLLGFLYCMVSVKRHKLISLFFHFIAKQNKFLAKDLMCIVWFLRNKNITTDSCIAHFGSNGVVMDYLIEAGLVKCSNLFTIFHGYEISRYDQLDLWQDLYGKLGGFLLPISEHWKNKLIELGANASKIEVVHMGVDVDRFAYSEKVVSTPLSILSVARATEKKGLKYAIEAVLECPIECEYRIIGDGSLMDSLKQAAASHKNSHRVIFEGAKPSSFVAESLKNTDLFLLPSVRDSKGDMEGIPVSLMEAMASGVVVLSTIHSGIPELISDGETGFLVPEKDSNAISAKIVEISQQSSLASIREAARQKVIDEFNASTLQTQLINILKTN
ncbi:glycosyltransferase [uncultured Alteromonas sp.]|jgi:colanic acid/amylovoran biosynthesis glycosyltransferase|uniref:glycosyltransferase n=1 Tax=uncultured Alteromonas sp. TaxID=179113 RepID=UPI00258E496A|nr:glycosyltransferase [uncultured Alteromonas sp.]